MKLSLFLFLFLGVFSSCGGDDKDEVILPTDLKIETQISTTENGKVTVSATAKNAKYFAIFFGETFDMVTSETGAATHTYSGSGTYTITVRAHTTPNQYISASANVTINLPPSNEGHMSPESYAGYNLVWRDEFDGASLNTENWTHEIGTGSNGWGNNELQYYRAENTTVEDGFLTITAKQEFFGGRSYTSSRMVTMGKQEFKYGRIDIRARLPRGQGLWPALWMLGANFTSVGWPGCGEIDIMEMIGGNGREKTVHGTLHWDNNGSHACTCDKPGYSLSSGTFADKFHVFSLTWNETEIKWYVNDVLFNTINITPAALSEFHEKYFLIFNVAVGGNWPGSPNATTIFPQKMLVDYVRVFQKE